jgi:hypothetical protein
MTAPERVSGVDASLEFIGRYRPSNRSAKAQPA